MINPIIFEAGLPAMATAAIFGTVGWRRSKRRRQYQYEEAVARERARREELLTGSSTLRPLADLWLRAMGTGQISILSVGTYGSRQLPFLLLTFLRAGASGHIGIIYLLELDDEERRICLDNIPPIFRDRVVDVSTHERGGRLGAPPSDAEADQEQWAPDVNDRAREWIARIQRETNPVVLLVLVSPGGMAALGRPPLDLFHERYPRIPIYAVTILDHKTVVRQRFPQIRVIYNQDQLICGTIVLDNRRFSQRSDLGIAFLFAAMVCATWVDQLPLHLWNGLGYVFPKETPGGYATLSVWAETLPVYHLPAQGSDLPEVYFTRGNLVEEKARRGIKTLMEHPELQAIPLEPAEAGSTRICYVIAPVVPEPDFKVLANRIDESLAKWHAKTDQDLLIQYASIGAPLTPESQEIPIVVVLLQPLADRGEQIDGLALGTHPVDAKFLPRPVANGLIPPVAVPEETESV